MPAQKNKHIGSAIPQGGHHQTQFGSLKHNFSVLESSFLPPPMRRERKFVTLADRSRDAAGARGPYRARSLLNPALVTVVSPGGGIHGV
jgi:hypothetical protein